MGGSEISMRSVQVRSYPLGKVLKAWMPFAILSVFVLVWGLPPVKLAMNQATTPAFQVVIADGAGGPGKVRPGPPGWDVPYLHNAVYRAAPVVAKPTPEACALRLQLALGDRDRLLPGGDCFGTAAGLVAGRDWRKFSGARWCACAWR